MSAGSTLDADGLTEAEAAVVESRVEESGKSREDVVAEVKAERAGPAARWEDVDELVSPVADEIVAVREALDAASQKRIADAGNDSDRALNEAARLKGNLDEINDYLIGVAETVAEETSGEPDVDVDESTAAELVRHLGDHPGDVDAIEAAENAREGGPRKTVLDAIDKARSRQEDQS